MKLTRISHIWAGRLIALAVLVPVINIKLEAAGFRERIGQAASSARQNIAEAQNAARERAAQAGAAARDAAERSRAAAREAYERAQAAAREALARDRNRAAENAPAARPSGPDHRSRPAVREPAGQPRGNLGDKLIEGMINIVTPEADEQTREVQRNAVKFMVDPSPRRSQEHFDNMMRATREMVSGPDSSSQSAPTGTYYPKEAVRAKETRGLSEIAEPQSGLIVHYPFDRDARDASGNSLDAIPQGSPEFVTGRIGGAVRLSGGQRVLLPALDFTRMSAFTVSLWVNLEQIMNPDGEAFITFGESGTGQIEIGAWNGTTDIIFNCGGEDYVRVKPPPAGWRLYTMTYESGTLNAFVDGELVGRTAARIRIGGSNAGLGTHWWRGGGHSTRFVGSIDEVRIYNRALTAGEVRQLHHD